MTLSKNSIIKWANFSKLNFAIRDITIISGAKKDDILKSPSPPPRSVLAVPLHWEKQITKGK